MDLTSLITALVPFIIYAIGWAHGYLKGKDAGIMQEVTRRIERDE